MYWQVYLHKTSVAPKECWSTSSGALNIYLVRRKLPASEPLKLFLKNRYTIDDFQEKRSLLQAFGKTG